MRAASEISNEFQTLDAPDETCRLALLADLCSRWKITPGMVATNYDVKSLVRARWQGSDPPEDSALTRGWRSQHVLPALLDVLEGRQSVRVGDIHKPAPFAWDGDGPPTAGDGPVSEQPPS